MNKLKEIKYRLNKLVYSVKNMNRINWRKRCMEATNYIYDFVPCGVIERCDEFIEIEDWKSLALELTEMECAPFLEWLFPYCYDEVPDDHKYNFVVKVYMTHGDSYECVREALREIKKYPHPKLTDQFHGMVHVYRAGNESPGKAKYSMSWTTDREVAEKFVVMQSWKTGITSALYEGWIPARKILAYTDGRNESEVIQFGQVRKIQEIRVTRATVRAILERGLGLRPCWKRKGLKPKRIYTKDEDKYTEAVNPSERAVALRDILGEGFIITQERNGKECVRKDIGHNGCIAIFFESEDDVIIGASRSPQYMYAQIIDKQYVPTVVKWLLKEYEHKETL